MSQFAIVLVLASAIVHAAWNAAGKTHSPSSAFFCIALSAGLLAMSPLLFLYGCMIPEIPPEVWASILLTGLCQALYYSMLAAAYRCGDMSLAYPLTRSTTVLFMAGLLSAPKFAGQFNTAYVAGLSFITGGTLALPMRSSADFRISRYFSKSSLFAVLAAVGTTGCMLVDQHVLNQMAALPCWRLSRLETLLLYAPLQSISAASWLFIWSLFSAAERVELRRILRENKKRAVMIGIGIYASYGLLLASMPYVQDLSYSVALRQVSIPAGMSFGIILLKEPRYLLKYLCGALITAGVVLIALA
jgi:drug/metabolite transporter (DMT)-like permease